MKQKPGQTCRMNSCRRVSSDSTVSTSAEAREPTRKSRRRRKNLHDNVQLGPARTVLERQPAITPRLDAVVVSARNGGNRVPVARPVQFMKYAVVREYSRFKKEKLRNFTARDVTIHRGAASRFMRASAGTDRTRCFRQCATLRSLHRNSHARRRPTRTRDLRLARRGVWNEMPAGQRL